MPPELPEQMQAQAASAPPAAYPDVWRSGRRRRARDALWRHLPGTVRFSRSENLLCQVEFCVPRQLRRPCTTRSRTLPKRSVDEQRPRGAHAVGGGGRMGVRTCVTDGRVNAAPLRVHVAADCPRQRVGSSSQADYLKRNAAMDDSIGGS